MLLKKITYSIRSEGIIDLIELSLFSLIRMIRTVNDQRNKKN
jgi:uncharacterized membrane protein